MKYNPIGLYIIGVVIVILNTISLNLTNKVLILT